MELMAKFQIMTLKTHLNYGGRVKKEVRQKYSPFLLL